LPTATPLPALTESLTADSVEITIDNPAALPFGGTIRIDAEQISYHGHAGSVLLAVTRGVNGTIASTHAAGATVTVLRGNGDANCDASVTAADLTALVRATRQPGGGACSPDMDGNGPIDTTDFSITVDALFAPQ